MNQTKIVINAVTQFIITAGGALTAVGVAPGTADPFGKEALISAGIVGAIAAAKSVQDRMADPSK